MPTVGPVVGSSSTLSMLLHASRPVYARHIRGHTGNPWNELADRVAAHACTGGMAHFAQLPPLPPGADASAATQWA
eukprot:9341327-Alexandrium_andersonii.AAC.1